VIGLHEQFALGQFRATFRENFATQMGGDFIAHSSGADVTTPTIGALLLSGCDLSSSTVNQLVRRLKMQSVIPAAEVAVTSLYDAEIFTAWSNESSLDMLTLVHRHSVTTNQGTQNESHSVCWYWDGLLHSGSAFTPYIVSSASPAQKIWADVYRALEDTAEDDAVDYMFHGIESAFSKQDLSFVDQLLDDVDTSRANAFVLEGLLRATFRARRNLRNWESCLARVSIKLASDKADVADILQGLISNDGKPLFTAEQAIL
jgi:hypothetical protein